MYSNIDRSGDSFNEKQRFSLRECCVRIYYIASTLAPAHALEHENPDLGCRRLLDSRDVLGRCKSRQSGLLHLTATPVAHHRMDLARTAPTDR